MDDDQNVPQDAAAYDFTTPRLFVAHRLRAGVAVPLETPQAHYLVNVLRRSEGDAVLAFNGVDGEWGCRLAGVRKRGAALEPERQTRPQTAPGDLHYLFAPLKRARLDYMVQKAVEMGVSRLAPVLTQRTQAERVNLARMRANAIEAAEQCGVLALPEIAEPSPLSRAVAEMPAGRRLVFCDEAAAGSEPVAPLQDVARGSPLAVLIGPEGGFTAQERAMLLARPGTLRISLGPRILRADTAAVAALAIVQAAAGDWM